MSTLSRIPPMFQASLTGFFKSGLFLALFLLIQGCESVPSKSSAGNSDKNSPVAIAVDKQPPATQPLSDAEPAENTLQTDTDTPANQPGTVWDRLLAGYQLDKPLNDRVQKEYDWYAKHPEYLERVQERAEPFLHFILNEIEKRNLPSELALLPVVESAFQPFAYSHGRAAGLWQFIPSTGKSYGLKQNWWYDGRRDVIASTKAALDYLDSLHKQLGGDWEYALAGYNAGAGNVRKGIRKNQRKNLPLDYWSLDLPRETEIYVPRLLAISLIIQDADKLGFTLKPIADEPRIAVVPVKSQIDLAKAARLAGLSIDELYNLNPAFNRWATDPQGPHRLVVPVEKQELLTRRLSQLDESEMMQWQRYKIRNGDSLSRIAKKHNTTTSIIKDVNNLKSHRIRAGKYLLIPVSSGDTAGYMQAVSQQLAKKQSVKQRGRKIEYTVQPGDNLWDISRTYKVSYRKIAGWNNMAPKDTLHPGQTLVIWQPRSGSSSVALNKSRKHISKVNYTIRKGDSLSVIADRFNVSVADIKKWNTLNKKYLQPGQKLTLRVDVTEQL